ncbi:winged helix-turn-helix transcriptional regulator [Halocatena marina]|uniref:winged helix-turn-helix transcriptional regulator n=1 Tax=Halocatena marina TaxID=2934937 RepID=UPI00200D6636|nr:winged helix-turn-helix transcriptional regulator [Halocatena marina]
MDPTDLRDVDWQIIDLLREGRNNAPNLAERTGYTRQYIAERLGTLRRDGILIAIGNGIYELDPEEVPDRGGMDDES